MKKVIAAISIMALIMLAACGSNETSGKRVDLPKMDSPTGAVAGISQEPEPTPASEPEEKGPSAAEAMQDLRSNPETVEQPTAKSGNFYPPVAVKGEGRDALKEKTRALFQQNEQELDVEADNDFGPRYADESDLPGDYGSDRFDD